MSKHLNRYFSPRSWKIKRKGIKYITKSNPGPHKLGVSLPLNVILRDTLGYAKTNQEVRFIVQNKNVIVDGIRRKDFRFPVGLFDVLSLNDIDDHFRILLDKKGKIICLRVGKEESNIKVCKIIGIRAFKGKHQVNLHDGKNILAEKAPYKVADSLLLSLDKGKCHVKSHIKLERGSLIFLTGGKHIGTTGKVRDINNKRIVYETDKGETVETLKRYAFPIGKDKAVIKIKNDRDTPLKK